MSELDDALESLRQATQGAQPTLIPPGAPEPAGPFDEHLAALRQAQQPQQPPTYTMAQPGQQPPDISTTGSLFNSAADSLLAMSQGTAPQVGRIGGGGNYQLAPQEQQDILARRLTPQIEQDWGKPPPQLDTEKYVVLRDPGTGQLAVYNRNPEMESGGWLGRTADALGHMFAYALPETGAGIPAVGRPAAASAPQLAVQATDLAGVSPSLASVGGAVASGAAKALGKVPIIGSPIAAGVQRGVNEIGSAAEQVANAMSPLGSAFNDFGSAAVGAGKAVQQGVNDFVRGAAPAGMTPEQIIAAPTRASSFRDKSAALYDRSSALMPPATPVPMPNYQAAAREVSTSMPNARNSSNTLESGLARQLNLDYIRDTARGPLTWQDAAAIRSQIGSRLGDPQLLNSGDRGALSAMYKGLTSDMENVLAGGPPEALAAFKRATQYYKAGIDRIDQLETLLKGPPEQTFAAINRAATLGPSADVGLLRSLQRSLPPEQWNDVGAAVLRNLGRPTTGGPVGVAENGFSMPSFVKNWDKLSDSSKDILFGANTPGSHRETLEALVSSAEQQKRIMSFGHSTASGATHGLLAVGIGAGLEHMLDLPTGHMGAILGAMGGYGASKALMNPGIARWWYSMPKTMASAPSYAVGMQRALSQLDQIGQIDPTAGQYIPAIRAAATPQ